MRLEVRKLLQDVLDALHDIERFVADTDFEAFTASKEKRAAVYFEFMIIGEAMTQVKKFDPSVVESITDAWKIIGFRNLIVHGYGKLKDEPTWDTVQRSLPILKSEVAALLAT